ECVEPRISNAGVCCVGVLRYKDSSRRRSCPQGRSVRARACDCRHGSASKSRSAVVRRRTGACRQIRCSCWPNLDEVAAGRVCTSRRKLRAVGFEERLIAGPILGPPDTQGALEDCSRSGGIWIRNDRRVKCRRFGRRDWAAGAYPFHRIGILEIHIVEIPRKGVESKRGVSHVKARLAAIAVDYLRPDYG